MTTYQIVCNGRTLPIRTYPVRGVWYACTSPAGHTGPVVQFNGAYFVNSDYPDEPGYDVGKYAYLREL